MPTWAEHRKRLEKMAGWRKALPEYIQAVRAALVRIDDLERVRPDAGADTGCPRCPYCPRQVAVHRDPDGTVTLGCACGYCFTILSGPEAPV